MGVAGVFNPGTPTATIIAEITRFAAERRSRRAADSPTDLSTPAGLARAITKIVDGQAGAAYDAAPPTAGLCLGVTGSPGVGKSTFIGKLAHALRGRGRRVAVVAVDPTSPVTGGALLGDRLRMMKREPDDGLFVRSISSAGQAGGLGPRAGEIVALMRSAGFKIVLIETVGAGQADVAVRDVANEVALVMMPGSGDTVQFNKAGIMEIATAIVVNKCDLDGADRTLKDLRDSIADDRPLWAVSSVRSEGFDPVCAWVEALLRQTPDGAHT
jgi:LAO/AO transport system ATPase